MNGFKKIFKGKKILVTGGTGSIGSEIVRQLLNYEPEQIRIFSRDDSKQFDLQQSLGSLKQNNDILRFLIGDIRDKDRLDRAFKDIDIVFHAAALKHVPFCEYNPFEAIKTNVNGTQNVLDLAIDHHVERMIAISSDKAVYPQTFLGITKLMMERMVISATNYAGAPEIKFSVVRFGNVINSRGSVIPLWIDQIKKGGPVTVTHKSMERYFMSTADAVNLVFMATQMMLGSEIFVLKMPKYKIHDLAVEIIKRYSNGKKIDIEIVGIRKNEKIDERLFTDEERALMIDAGVFNIIQPNEEEFLKRESLYKISESPKFTTQADILSSF
jgi:FlaA1/EpsC-like NDP-sugar epimerase